MVPICYHHLLQDHRPFKNHKFRVIMSYVKPKLIPVKRLFYHIFNMQILPVKHLLGFHFCCVFPVSTIAGFCLPSNSCIKSFLISSLYCHINKLSIIADASHNLQKFVKTSGFQSCQALWQIQNRSWKWKDHKV